MSHSLTDKFKLSFRLGGSRGGEKMPSKKQYNLVQNDDYDTRVPLHSEEAFHHGIVFQAKYIGTLDVPRPTSRVEIVAAMRRIRYEFKAKGVKKKKVTVEISVDGVKVTLRKKKKKKETKWSDAEGDSQELMQHPIYRIFYVSHDSSDLKIFSYIARDGVNNVFKCNVFKSNKKSQAMRIVRTVGQAFEVCHKLSPEPQPAAPSNSAACDLSQEAALSISDRASDVSEKSKKVGAATSPNIFEPETADLFPIELTQKILQFEPFVLKPHNDVDPSVNVDPHQYNQEVPAPDGHLTLAGNASPCIASPQSAEHREKFLAESLAQQRQQTRAATAQLAMLNDQLVVEKAARMEAQARTHQLLLHNKELIDHISMLVAHLQDRERGGTGLQTGHFSTMPQWEGAGRGKQSATATATLNNNNEPPLKPPQPTQPAPNVLRTTADITLHARPTQNTEEKNANDLSSILLDLSNAHTNYRKMNTKTNEKSSYFSSADEIISDSVRSIQDLLQNNDSFENAYALRPHNEIEDNRFSVVADVERENECQYIRPLSQIGTITTLDEEGRVRIVVPTKKNPQPIISRTTSERVPNKSVLMSQLREQWGRHTTK